jgi:hypothetical protein
LTVGWAIAYKMLIAGRARQFGGKPNEINRDLIGG